MAQAALGGDRGRGSCTELGGPCWAHCSALSTPILGCARGSPSVGPRESSGGEAGVALKPSWALCYLAGFLQGVASVELADSPEFVLGSMIPRWVLFFCKIDYGSSIYLFNQIHTVYGPRDMGSW